VKYQGETPLNNQYHLKIKVKQVLSEDGYHRGVPFEEGGYGGYVLYENRTMKPVEIVLRRGEG
jgi:hypothetical protein